MIHPAIPCPAPVIGIPVGTTRERHAMNVIHHPSPNYSERPAGRGPELIVMHATESRDNSLDWLCDPESDVSAHYLIDRDGTIYQLVAESKKAWHAGVSHWLGRDSVNEFSIGIEMANKMENRKLYRAGEEYPEPFPEEQFTAAAFLVADILRRRGLPLDRVVSHSDIAPTRRHDPGTMWEWDRFRKAVILLLHPDPAPHLSEPVRRAA